MTKIVYNRCYGGFSLSEKAHYRYAELKGLTLYPEASRFASLMLPTYWTVPPEAREGKVLADDAWHAADLDARKASNEFYKANSLNLREANRADPVLVQVVEELGEEADGECAQLAIAEVPAGTRYRIDEYDGNESVMTVDDYEWSVA